MLKKTGTYTDIDRITREIYIEKLQGVVAEYARLFMENPWLKSSRKASEECQKIGAMIRVLRFNKEIPDEKCLDAIIKEAEAACKELFSACLKNNKINH